MKPVVTIIDYGVGNILSVTRSFEYCGAKVILTSDPKETSRSKFLVLPGVGAFSVARQELSARGLDDAIKEYSQKERPFLGICLGMQLMLEQSEEFGVHNGLGMISGNVREIPSLGKDRKQHKIPHTGWVPIFSTGISWNSTILEGFEKSATFYFTHSFTAHPDVSEQRIADASYNGYQLCAVIKKDYLYGCQFHPEKSGPVGLKMISNFLTL